MCILLRLVKASLYIIGWPAVGAIASYCVLRITYCVLRIVYYVLRIAYCVFSTSILVLLLSLATYISLLGDGLGLSSKRA